MEQDANVHICVALLLPRERPNAILSTERHDVMSLLAPLGGLTKGYPPNSEVNPSVGEKMMMFNQSTSYNLNLRLLIK